MYSGKVTTILCILLNVSVANTSRGCTYMMNSRFDSCGDRGAEIQRYAERNSRDVENVENYTIFGDECISHGKLCRKVYKMARIYRQSFGAAISVHASEMLTKCCGDCPKHHHTKLLPPLDLQNLTYLQSFDFIYPVYGIASVRNMYGFNFLPVLNIPSSYYVTLKESKREVTMKMISACLSMWPVAVICLLLCVVAGFCIWITDTWKNECEFPRPFISGMCEGYWCSFVTMTTVGYGDSAPKSLPARLFSVFWIFTGITVFAIFVSNMTGNIMDMKHPHDPDLKGARVGVPEDTLFCSLIIAQHGGISHEVKSNDTVLTIIHLINKLKEKRIDGFLVNRATYYYFSRKIRENTSNSKYHSKYKVDTEELRRTEEHFKGDELVAGVLVNNPDDYEFFKSYYDSNWVQIQTCYDYQVTSKAEKYDHDTWKPLKNLFIPFLVGSFIIIGIISFVGVIYEYKRKKSTNYVEDDANNEHVLSKNEAF